MAASAPAAQGLLTTLPQRPSFPMNEDGWRFGKIVPEDGMGPVRRLNETLKLSRVLQLSKLEGMVPVRKLRERSTSVMEGSVEISHGIIPVRELL